MCMSFRFLAKQHVRKADTTFLLPVFVYLYVS